MTDQTGAITFAQTYDPYGVVTTTSGSSQTEYGFTGEQYGDSTQLVYLRARYYNPADGGFLTKDPSRAESNLYLYTMGNPVNHVDPSGYITVDEADDANDRVAELATIYGVKIVKDWGYRLIPVPPSSLPPGIVTGILYSDCEWEYGNWRNLDELNLTLAGVKKMADKLGGSDKFRSALWGMPIIFKRMSSDRHTDGVSVAWTVLDIKFYNDTFNVKFGADFASGTVVHELAHVWDTRQTPIFSLSTEMARKTQSHRFICESIWSITCPYKFDPNGLEDPPTPYGMSDGARGAREDFADSFAICVYPNFKGVPSLNKYPIRKDYIEGLINGNKRSQ
jgi:RHS repeat-associated protein